ncbi:hypothetical protein SGPA1_60112 [Streptomyces misionensis JCM 4497]
MPARRLPGPLVPRHRHRDGGRPGRELHDGPLTQREHRGDGRCVHVTALPTRRTPSAARTPMRCGRTQAVRATRRAAPPHRGKL